MVDATQYYEAAGKQYNVDPLLLRSMALHESQENTYDPKTGQLLTSPAGAKGWMQFMPDTAKQYGVDVTDPKSSIFGAAHYVSDLLDQNKGDLTAALAGYSGTTRNPAQTQTYAKAVLDNYLTLQQQQRAQLRASGATSEAQPDVSVIDVGSTPPPSPALNLSGRTGTAVAPASDDFSATLYGPKGTTGGTPTKTAAPPATAAPAPAAQDFSTTLYGAPTAPADPAIPTITVTPQPPPGATPQVGAAAAVAPPAAPAAMPSSPAPQPVAAPPQAAPAPAAAVAPAPAPQAQPAQPAPPSGGVVPPEFAGQSMTSAPTPSWYQRNIGFPVAAMMRPDLPAAQGQNYLLNAPTLQSLGAGIVQGQRNIAQTLSNAGEWVDARVPWLQALDRSMGYPDQSTLPQQTEAFRQQYPSDTTAALGELGSGIAGTPGLGLVAGGVGRVAGALPVVGPVVGPAAAGAVGGGLQNLMISGGTGQDPRQALESGALGGALLGGGFGMLARIFGGAGGSAARQAEQAAADRLGISLSAGQRAGPNSVANRVEDATKILPGSGAAKFAEQQREDITRVLAREAGIPGPVSRIDTNVLNHGFDLASDTIENAARRITVPSDARFMHDLAVIERASQQAGPATAQAYTVRNLGDQLLNLMANNGNRLPGVEFQRFIARGGPLDTALRSSVPEVRAAGNALREMLLSAAERGGQGSREALSDLTRGRYNWKVLSTIAPAITRTQAGTDEMGLPGLAQAIRSNFNMRLVGPGNDMQDLARLISGPLRTLPSSGTAERAAAMRWLGLGGEGAGAGGLAWMLGSPHAAEIAAASAGIPFAANVAAGRLLRYGPGLGVPALEEARATFNPLLPRLLGPHVGNQLLLPAPAQGGRQ